MHAAVWTSVRAASKSTYPARLIRGRRYPRPSRARSFHTTTSRAQTSSPPSNPDNTPTERNDTNNSLRDEQDKNGEEAKRGTAAEDPEEIAQKLQQSKDMVRRYGSALKRTQRKNKAQGLPPVRIPNRFMEKRIRLREEHGTKLAPMRRWDCLLTMKDGHTGEQGALSYPFWNPERGAAILGPLCNPMLTSSEEKDKIDTILSRTEAPSGAEGSEKTRSRKPRPSSSREMAELHLNNNISPIILAEIRATVTACLSTTMPNYNSSFPSTKTNLILHGTTPNAETYLKKIVTTLADDMDADLVSLDPQDLAQIAGDYLGEGPEPTPHSIRSLGYETYKVQADLASEVQETLEEVEEQAVDEQGNPEPPPADMPRAIAFDLTPILKALGFPSKAGQNQNNTAVSSAQYTPAQSENDVRLEDLKLGALLEALVDSPEAKRQLQSNEHVAQDTPPAEKQPSPSPAGTEKPDFFDYSMFGAPLQFDFKGLSDDGTKPLGAVQELLGGRSPSRPDLEITIGPPSQTPHLPYKPTIIYVRDIKELNATHYGSRILQKLEDIVRKRRASGQNIMILGTTCSRDFVPELSANGVRSLQSEGDAYYSRTIVVPVSKTDELSDAWSLLNDEMSIIPSKMLLAERNKHRAINLRHLQDMLRSLDPDQAKQLLDSEELGTQFSSLVHMFPDSIVQRVWPYDEVHRVALTALGLHLQHPSSPHLNWAHVTLAAHLIRVSDKIKFNWASQTRLDIDRVMGPDQLRGAIKDHKGAINKLKSGLGRVAGSQGQDRSKTTEPPQDALQKKIKDIISKATKHEKALAGGIINPAQIKTTFSHVHVPTETIEAVRTLTSLSLLRPDAFNYGVLATDKISGILLYGPPGTGKTLLAKAVAKESGATVLEVSGSVINDKYVGEGEKNVAAIFSLARKLSPCVVFLDEADSIFGSRDGSKNRVTHRDILNQFLKEWDGLTDMSVFIMVATNRPFDLDDAVIRRLPRRLLVDLPTMEDRKKILEIHLRDEQLGPEVDIQDLAKRTPFYSGSDLKNLAVAAALACVREENEQAVIAALKAAVEPVTEEPASGTQTDMEVVSSSPPTPETSQDSLPPPIPIVSSLPLPPIPSISPITTTTTPPPPSPTPSAILVPNTTYKFPLKRTLQKHHFEKALLEISASISEDMTSLNAIKKFDEQFGDRKGRKKRNAYGFGLGERDEKVGRVRG